MADITFDATGSGTVAAYTVTWTVTAATDMPEEVFKVQASDNVFQGVILAADLVYPTVRTAGQPFYRLSTVQRTYDTLAEAQTAITNVAADMQVLVDSYNAGLVAFLTTVTTTVS